MSWPWHLLRVCMRKPDNKQILFRFVHCLHIWLVILWEYVSFSLYLCLCGSRKFSSCSQWMGTFMLRRIKQLVMVLDTAKKMENPLFVIHSRALTRYHPFFHKERCLWISEKHSLFRNVRFELSFSVGAVLNASISRQTRLAQECRMEGYISKSFMMVISPVSVHRPWRGRQGWGEKLSREERRGSVRRSGRPGCHLLLHGVDTCWDHCLKGPHRHECTACTHTNTHRT